ncbi:hypothetical protein HDU76_009295, partial [Blyttiomyces sp. JEL0837]
GSWLEEIWKNKAYLSNREPLFLHQNFWAQFPDYPNHPADLLKKPPPPGVLTVFQVTRTAGLINAMMNFKSLIESKRLPADTVNGTQLCMNQYKKLFGATRIPGETVDSISESFPAESRHVVVLTQGQIYKVDVLRPDGSRLPNKEIERLLFAVGKDSLETEPEAAISTFTATDRDTWFKAYDHLQKLGPSNAENLNIIKDALFAVCLDNHATRRNPDHSHVQMFHNNKASNRWFDKGVSLIVASNGKAGVNVERTLVDMGVSGRFIEYLVANEPVEDPASFVASPPMPLPTKLKWVVDEELQKAVQKAQKTGSTLAQDIDSVLLESKVYGERYIREVAKSNPEAFVQIALQLVWKRMHENPTAVTQEVSTRVFKHGRTETVRPLTEETAEFVNTFDDDDILYDDKRVLYAKAVRSYVKNMEEAAAGKGFDSHLLALKSIATPEEANDVALFTDAAYVKSTQVGIHANNLGSAPSFIAGVGPKSFDGYGVAYAIDKDGIRFAIADRKSSSFTNVREFRTQLEKALLDIMILFPKRSEVWGKDWRQKHDLERKEQFMFNRMKILSDKYLAKRAELEKKYSVREEDEQHQQ